MTIELASRAQVGPAIALARQNKPTLGVLPDEVFHRSQVGKHLLVATSEGRLVGYLLSRYVLRRDTISITHLCIDPEARGKGVARRLVQELFAGASTTRGIELKCRADYDIDAMWPRLGFQHVGEVPGRAEEGSVLKVWWMRSAQRSLLDFQRANQRQPPVRAMLDSNVFFDINRGEGTSEVLQADWLQDAVEYLIAPELLNEIGRGQDASSRARQRALATRYSTIEVPPAELDLAYRTLESTFGQAKQQRDRSDRLHLAAALAGGVEIFVTRDDGLLSQAEVLAETFGLSIVTPHELVTEVDRLSDGAAYQPRRLGGSIEFKVARAGKESLEGLEAFVLNKYSEGHKQLRHKLQELLGDPKESEVIVVETSERQPIGLLGISVDTDQICKISLIRASEGRHFPTLSRQLLQCALDVALQRNCLATRIDDTHALNSDPLRSALADSSFVMVDGVYWRLHPRIATEMNRAIAFLEGLKSVAELDSPITWALDQLRLAGADKDSGQLLRLERMLHPAKFLDIDVPNYIIPIRETYARQVVDARVAEQSLFGTDARLALSHERVYYKSSRGQQLRTPARILWYVSRGRNEVSAASYLDEVQIGSPKAVFKRFSRLGTYGWDQVFGIAGKRLGGSVTAMRFSRTEILGKRMGFAEIQRVLQLHGRKKNQLQTALAVSGAIYASLYQGGQGSNV